MSSSTTSTVTTLRQSTLETLGLGTVLDIYRRGSLPVSAEEMVARVFGPEADRGSLVISGANGIVGAGKTMQLGSRLQPFGVTTVALDLPGAADGVSRQYGGLAHAFGSDGAANIMESIVRLSYDGRTLPASLAGFKPRFLLEAIPEILELKRSHYAMFREAFPEIQIRSVTSGFPSRELGVGVAHPAFPHNINKIYETVETSENSEIPRLLWSLGLVPLPVADYWSFVLDVVFCGLTNAAIRYHRASNMPYWKIDKLIRRDIGPNPFRANDAIGAKGANFLIWSCLVHLTERYGAVFAPTPDLIERKDTGQDYYPPNHFRPLVDWKLDDREAADLEAWVVGALIQMTSLMLHEDRAHFAHMNIIGETCAQLRQGVLALVRRFGADHSRGIVARYHQLHPAAAENGWHPDALDRLDTPAGQQLYVNAEHDGTVGLVTLGRESYNWDVDAELNRALDWLVDNGIESIILSGDFHLTGQLVGADTAEFFAAFEDDDAGHRLSLAWSRTARRLRDDFRISVGVVHGKRCLGGMLELMMHCRFLLATADAQLGLPEVTLPVVPGMEGCHWPFRRIGADAWPRLLSFVLDGRPVRGRDAERWLIDRSGSLEEVLGLAWNLATGESSGVEERLLETGTLDDFRARTSQPEETGDASTDGARRAIYDTIIAATAVSLADALDVQSRHTAGFFSSALCRRGVVGSAWAKTTRV